MSLTLTVDGDRWRAHLRARRRRHPGPGPGRQGQRLRLHPRSRSARKSAWLGVEHDRGRHLRRAARGRHPLRRRPARAHPVAALRRRPRPRARTTAVIHTVGRVEDLDDLLARQPDARFVLELLTSMRRHGFTARELWTAAERLREHRPPGVGPVSRASRCTCPLTQGSHLGEVRRLLNDAVAAGLEGLDTVWVSHLTGDELATLRSSYADFTVRPRIGTGLWLGDRGALSVTATVLDVHAVERGDVFGYRGRIGPQGRSPARRQRRHRPRHRPGGTHRRLLAQGAGRHPGARRPRRGRVRALAVLDRRQAAALRRAAAHAGLDAVPAGRRAGARGRRRRSTSGCATPTTSFDRHRRRLTRPVVAGRGRGRGTRRPGRPRRRATRWPPRGRRSRSSRSRASPPPPGVEQPAGPPAARPRRPPRRPARCSRSRHRGRASAASGSSQSAWWGSKDAGRSSTPGHQQQPRPGRRGAAGERGATARRPRRTTPGAAARTTSVRCREPRSGEPGGDGPDGAVVGPSVGSDRPEALPLERAR